MLDQKVTQIGTWFLTPDTEKFPSTCLVVTAKNPEIYILNEAPFGEALNAWEVQWLNRAIDCSVDFKLDEVALSSFMWGGRLPESITCQFNNARHHGKMQRSTWKY